jgi:hypothetical protein
LYFSTGGEYASGIGPSLTILRFQTEQFTLKDGPVRITLFSRRCNRRLGTRMWRRGANLEGATANFVETEQLVEYEGLTSSFIEVRGSIPLLWEQIVDLSYKPRPSIIEHEEMTKVVQRHFHDLLQRYGDTMVIDLTDKVSFRIHIDVVNYFLIKLVQDILI